MRISPNVFTSFNPLLSRRAACVGLLTIAGVAAKPALAKRTPMRVLFICQYGTAKSAIAREMFRKRARERRINVMAFSRGITPEQHVSPSLRVQLIADGIDSMRDGVVKLTSSDLKRADMIVAFNPLPSHFSATDALDWSAVPSTNDAYALARADLVSRIDALLDRIEQQQ